jgi:hypothetical protein
MSAEPAGRATRRIAVVMAAVILLFVLVTAYGFGMLHGIAASIPLPESDDEPDE